MVPVEDDVSAHLLGSHRGSPQSGIVTVLWLKLYAMRTSLLTGQTYPRRATTMAISRRISM